MPQNVESLVEKLLGDSSFYPELDAEARKSRAYAVANAQLNASLDDPIFFSALDGETVYSMVRGADGSPSMLVFKGARLASAETNKNQDAIDAQGIKELAATIAGWPISLEHQARQLCGMFTAGRVGAGDTLLVDGAVWADRFPEAAQGIMDGSESLSIEARANKASCSICASEFESAASYCEHLSNRRSNGAVRHLSGLKARGGAITKKPAGTNTRFDPNHIYVVAAHQDEASSDMNMGDHDQGDSSGSMAEMPKTMMADATTLDIKESTMTEDEVNKIKADLEAALKKITDLEAATAEKDKTVADLTAKLTEAETGRMQLQASARRSKLGAVITDEEWDKQKDVILAMPEPMFDLMASKMAAPAPKTPVRVPTLTLSGGNGADADRLTLS